MPDNHTRQIVNKAWSFAHLLRDDGLSYMVYNPKHQPSAKAGQGQ